MASDQFYLKDNLGFYVPGLGLILFLVLVTIIGFLSTYFIGKKFYRFVDRTVSRFPLLSYIYPSLRQIFSFLFSQEHVTFKKVVLVEYPSRGIWSIGFVSNEGFKELNQKTGSELLAVYIPTALNIASGILIFTRRTSVQFLDISVIDAMKLVVSGGVLNPKVLLEESGKNS